MTVGRAISEENPLCVLLKWWASWKINYAHISKAQTARCSLGPGRGTLEVPPGQKLTFDPASLLNIKTGWDHVQWEHHVADGGRYAQRQDPSCRAVPANALFNLLLPQRLHYSLWIWLCLPCSQASCLTLFVLSVGHMDKITRAMPKL